MPNRSVRTTSRDEILDAFTELVAKHGYDSASLAMVAERVGVVKGTIVHHFGTKDRMMAESHEAYMGRRMSEAVAVVSALDDPAEQLVAMIYSNVRAHRDDRAATISFLREFTRFQSNPELARVRSVRREYASITTTILRRGMAQGIFHELDVTLTAMQIFGAQNHMWTWYRPDGDYSSEYIASQFASNLLGGIATRERSHVTPERVLELWAVVGPTVRAMTTDGDLAKHAPTST